MAQKKKDPNTLLKLLGFGAAREAGETISRRRAQIEAAVEGATGRPLLKPDEKKRKRK